MNVHPIKRKIRISDRELATREQKIEFIKLVGEQQYERLVHQFAIQRVPPERPGGYSPDDIGKMSPAQYEAARPAIQADLAKTVSKDKPVFGTFEIADYQLNTAGAKGAFVDLFGYERFTEALGIEDYAELSDQAYHKALKREYKPYTVNSTSNPVAKVNVAERSESDHAWKDKSGKEDKSE